MLPCWYVGVADLEWMRGMFHAAAHRPEKMEVEDLRPEEQPKSNRAGRRHRSNAESDLCIDSSES